MTRKHLMLWIVLALAGGMVLFALFAPTFAPHDPLKPDLGHILSPPSKDYPFGTDQVGRCICSRILYGARISLGMTFLLLALVFMLGLLIGMAAGMAGGVLDAVIMRIADAILAFPDIVFAIAVVGILGAGMLNTILALSIIWWTKYARLTRVLVMGVKYNEYMDAARMAGAGRVKLLMRYIVPNILPQLVVQLVLDVGGMMLALSGLSFLGLGVQPPRPEWGNMLNEGRTYLQTAPWLLIYPGLAIFTVVVVCNILGDTVRDVLDPRYH